MNLFHDVRCTLRRPVAGDSPKELIQSDGDGKYAVS